MNKYTPREKKIPKDKQKRLKDFIKEFKVILDKYDIYDFGETDFGTYINFKENACLYANMFYLVTNPNSMKYYKYYDTEI